MADSVPVTKSNGRPVPAPIEQYFQVSLFLLIATGFATLVSTGKLDSISVMLVSIGLVVRAYLLLKGRTYRIPESFTSYLGLLYLLFYVVDFFLLSQNFVEATVHLLLFGLVIKIFSTYRDRDYLYLAILSFLAVLSAAVLTVDSVFFASLSAFVLIAVLTFISFEIRRSARFAASVQTSGLEPPQFISRIRRSRKFQYSLSGVGIVLVIAILVFSTGIFFVLPRLSGGYLGQLAQQNDLVSGFSDNVRLGEIGQIQQSSQVVMHLRVNDGQRGYSLMLRGTTLSDFDGTNWFNPPQNLVTLPSMGGTFDLRSAEPKESTLAVGQAHDVIRYRIVLEPIGTNALFTVPAPTILFGPFKEITASSSQTYINTDRSRPTNSYAGLSDIAVPPVERLKDAGSNYPDEVARRYLQLPPDLDPRIARVAREITANSRNNMERAAAIHAYLSKFEYTLELPRERHKDPVAYFLFERKAGHCEYFAAAMAIMLRDVGIPSRLVNGFRGGEYNELTGNYIVRAKDAHTWVEAYFPGVGWYAFDPTPAASIPAQNRWAKLGMYIDAMREFWREWVVNYDFFHQRRLSYAAVNASGKMARSFRTWIRAKYRVLLEQARKVHHSVETSPGEYALKGMLTVCGLVILLSIPKIAHQIRQHRIARNPSEAPKDAASIWYSRLTTSLARRGHRKTPAQTPNEFVQTIEDTVLRNGVAKFTTHYERARFGNAAEDAIKLPEIYDEITTKK